MMDLGVPQTLVVTVPLPGSVSGASTPTGIVFNSSSDFKVSKGNTSGAAAFIFATEDGTISGWSPGVDPTNAILMVDNSASGAVYKGLALGGNGTAHFLYATNFNTGTDRCFRQFFQTGHTFRIIFRSDHSRWICTLRHPEY